VPTAYLCLTLVVEMAQRELTDLWVSPRIDGVSGSVFLCPLQRHSITRRQCRCVQSRCREYRLRIVLAGRPKVEIEKKVRAAADSLQLTSLLDREPKALSGGQRQRVAIGRAIVRDPKIFLFDEPLSNLDASLRAQMRLEIAELHSRLKATMVYVTHDQVEAMTMSDKIVVLNGGQIETRRHVDRQPTRILQHDRNGVSREPDRDLGVSKLVH